MESIVEGAFASQLFAAFYDRVKATLNNRSELELILGNLRTKLQLLEPYFSHEVLTELGFKTEDEQTLKDKIDQGTSILEKLSGMGRVADILWCQTRKYRSEVQELEQFYDNLYKKMRVHEVLNVKEALMLSRRILESVLLIESKMDSLGRIESRLGSIGRIETRLESMGRMESKLQSVETKLESMDTKETIFKALEKIETKLESMNAIENQVNKLVEAKSSKERMRGKAAFENGDYELAVKAYTVAISMDPMDLTLWSNRSLCLLRHGESQLALEDALKCCTINRNWPKSQYRAGQAYMKLEKFEEALEHFKTGVNLTHRKNKELLEAYMIAGSMSILKAPGGGSKN